MKAHQKHCAQLHLLSRLRIGKHFSGRIKNIDGILAGPDFVLANVWFG